MKDLFGCLILILFVVLAFKTCDGCGNSSDEPEIGRASCRERV